MLAPQISKSVFLTAKKRKGHKRAARFARRPLVMFFLLSLGCRALFGRVSLTVVGLAPVSASCL